MSRVTADNLPPTARAIALLLASTPTVQDAQPGVLHQLLEFSHRYTAQILSDALVYAEHAGRSGKIELDDVMLAVQARVGWEFGGRVPKEVRSHTESQVFFDALNTFGSYSIYTRLLLTQMQCHYPQYQKYSVSDYPPLPTHSPQLTLTLCPTNHLLV